jgi:hypothetical protein
MTYDIENINKLINEVKNIFCIDTRDSWHGDNEIIDEILQFIKENENATREEIRGMMFCIIDEIMSKSLDNEYAEEDRKLADKNI